MSTQPREGAGAQEGEMGGVVGRVRTDIPSQNLVDQPHHTHGGHGESAEQKGS